MENRLVKMWQVLIILWITTSAFSEVQQDNLITGKDETESSTIYTEEKPTTRDSSPFLSYKRIKELLSNSQSNIYFPREIKVIDNPFRNHVPVKLDNIVDIAKNNDTQDSTLKAMDQMSTKTYVPASNKLADHDKTESQRVQTHARLSDRQMEYQNSIPKDTSGSHAYSGLNLRSRKRTINKDNVPIEDSSKDSSNQDGEKSFFRLTHGGYTRSFPQPSRNRQHQVHGQKQVVDEDSRRGRARGVHYSNLVRSSEEPVINLRPPSYTYAQAVPINGLHQTTPINGLHQAAPINVQQEFSAEIPSPVARVNYANINPHHYILPNQNEFNEFQNERINRFTPPIETVDDPRSQNIPPAGILAIPNAYPTENTGPFRENLYQGPIQYNYGRNEPRINLGPYQRHEAITVIPFTGGRQIVADPYPPFDDSRYARHLQDLNGEPRFDHHKNSYPYQQQRYIISRSGRALTPQPQIDNEREIVTEQSQESVSSDPMQDRNQPVKAQPEMADLYYKYPMNEAGYATTEILPHENRSEDTIRSQPYNVIDVPRINGFVRPENERSFDNTQFHTSTRNPFLIPVRTFPQHDLYQVNNSRPFNVDDYLKNLQSAPVRYNYPQYQVGNTYTDLPSYTRHPVDQRILSGIFRNPQFPTGPNFPSDGFPSGGGATPFPFSAGSNSAYSPIHFRRPAPGQKYKENETIVPNCIGDTNATMCLDDQEYPKDEILYHLDSEALLIHKLTPSPYAGGEEMESEDAQEKSSQSEEAICNTKVENVRPLRAMNTQGKWKILVNTGDPARGLVQTIKTETCSTPDVPCNHIDNTVETKCVQKYTSQKLLTWNRNRGIHMDSFDIPIACSCEIVVKS